MRAYCDGIIRENSGTPRRWQYISARIERAVAFRAQGKEHDLSAGNLLTLAASIPDDVHALEDSAFLLTTSWRSNQELLALEDRGHGKVKMRIACKRAYDQPAPQDGFRILVDRLWPRGLTKEKAHIDLWLKEIAPSTELRRWFGHDPAKWVEFQRRYRAELRQNKDAVSKITAQARKTPVTLVYAAKDERHNDAIVLLGILNR